MYWYHGSAEEQDERIERFGDVIEVNNRSPEGDWTEVLAYLDQVIPWLEERLRTGD